MIKEKEYALRRKRVLKKLKPNSIAILFSQKNQIRSNDTHFTYRQSSNFYYLSGFKETNSAIVLLKDQTSTKSILFVQKKDDSLELWNGKILGVDEAKKSFDFDEIYSYDELESKLQEVIVSKTKLYFEFEKQDERVESVLKLTTKFYSYKNISKIIQKLRVIKSKSEIKLIKNAISITAKAHKKAMQMKKVGKYEYEVEAKMEYIFKKYGAYSNAYTTIVASGNNANTLHYIKNSRKMKKDELVLIDAGCEYEYYASDITRTISTTNFTKAQKELYNLVLSVQKYIISLIKDGVKRSFLQEQSERLLAKGLKKLGILDGKLDDILEQQRHKKYFPHGIGHHMGLDVHDEVAYKTKNGNEIELKKGMILTVEPALYISKNDKSVSKKYRGIGIRIEDDILVTKNGCKNLSKKIKK